MTMKTFVNYCGGKSSLVKTLLEYVPPTFHHYYEPFLGGGALFLETAHGGLLKGKSCFLSDLDPLLMTMWRAIQEDGQRVVALLKDRPYARETWDTCLALLNDTPNDCPFETAAAYIYVKTHSFSSILRRNKTKGRLSPSFRQRGMIQRLRLSCIEAGIPLLQHNVHLFGCTFSAMHPQRGDFVFLDPPYLKADQALYAVVKDVYPLLMDYCHSLTRRGVHWIMTNSGCPEIREEFKDYPIVSLGERVAWCAPLCGEGRKKSRSEEVMVLSPGLGKACQKDKKSGKK